MKDILKTTHRLVAGCSAFVLFVSGCAKEAPDWLDYVDAATIDTGEGVESDVDTGNDTGADTAPVDTDPAVLPPGVATALKGTAGSIDGLLTDAAWDISVPVNRVIEGTGNNTARFGVLWDDFYLYIGIHVEDPNLKNDSLLTWQDDSVEIFIDADYSGGSVYDEHDIQYWMEYATDILTVTYGKPLNAKHSLQASEAGYEAELAVPWDDLGVIPSAGMRIGFDIGINDDDNGGGRDAHHMWNGNDDNWESTANFGTVILR